MTRSGSTAQSSRQPKPRLLPSQPASGWWSSWWWWHRVTRTLLRSKIHLPPKLHVAYKWLGTIPRSNPDLRLFG